MASVRAKTPGFLVYLGATVVWLFFVTVCVSGFVPLGAPVSAEGGSHGVNQTDAHPQEEESHDCGCEDFGSFVIAPPAGVAVAAAPEGLWLWNSGMRGTAVELLVLENAGGVRATGPPPVAPLPELIASRCRPANAPPSEE